jgi:hypothetical protein
MLSSQNLLRKYKNSIHQEAGINTDMLAWMSNEARIKNLPRGLIFDEMSMQPDLQFFQKNGNVELIGFTVYA